MMRQTRRLARLVLVTAALILAMFFARHWPKDQSVHYVLGDGAARRANKDARGGAGDFAAGDGKGGEDWTREASFRYARGRAPRVVTHEPRLPDGDYTVEIEIVASGSERDDTTGRNLDLVTRRHVSLSGGVTSIDLAPSIPR
jgi:hypothetical protein